MEKWIIEWVMRSSRQTMWEPWVATTISVTTIIPTTRTFGTEMVHLRLDTLALTFSPTVTTLSPQRLGSTLPRPQLQSWNDYDMSQWAPGVGVLKNLVSKSPPLERVRTDFLSNPLLIFFPSKYWDLSSFN